MQGNYHCQAATGKNDEALEIDLVYDPEYRPYFATSSGSMAMRWNGASGGT